MGQPEQFAKETFAEEVELLTRGALAWVDPPEIRLLKVQPDGMLRVRDPARLAELEPPWSEAGGHDEALLELKLAGDHVGRAAIERARLRRQARQVERVEDPAAPWRGLEPLWISAPHVPGDLREIYQLELVAPGCYRVGPAVFSFLWIAANELPLREDLVPFLLTRSGKALDEFGLWVARRRPPDWVLDMLDSIAMSPPARQHVFNLVPSDDPTVMERRRDLVRMFIDRDPILAEQIEGAARLAEARATLRRVLARRGLVLAAADEARIDACTDRATLERWLDEAIVATSAAEVFRSTAG